jgi:hypothetical protein
MIPVITSLDDGRMKNFQRMVDGGGVGFQGHELVLYQSLKLALETIADIAEEVKVNGTNDEGTS